jgi:succinyl-diaminopimelate desuccinylase
MIPPHVVPKDSPFIETLLKSYETVTGLKGECLSTGGGTYVHNIKNGVAFGAVMPGIDTNMHGADEFFDIDNIVLATKIFAEAIQNLCK